MRFAALFTLASAFLSGFVNALPAESEGQLQSLSAELTELAAGLRLKVGRRPQKSSSCPRTDNGPGRVYPQHTYTDNQITKAFMGGAQLAAAGKQIGDSESSSALQLDSLVTPGNSDRYPHVFGNKEKVKFPCGKNTMEFPIQIDNNVYGGGSVANVPDRVVFEYKKTKREFIVEYCGVMRHGPRDFILCPQ
ncbi:hypothetical protein XA68_14150 [Ophiocordyceps unilateralis]|uniref:Uncharacterized protein n=1 Tax=Ophiocordyceps unilateralis TaxID=268505 RepID=A0A2A9P9B5_OPHUN|nr:hypothetical protein XA68_14150 [Ophiocordyceps unilateralis]